MSTLKTNSCFSNPKSYVKFDHRGMSVDLNAYFKTEEGKKAFKQVAKSGFKKKTKVML